MNELTRLRGKKGFLETPNLWDIVVPREIRSNISQPYETRKISKRQSNLTPKGTKSKVSRKKEKIKDLSRNSFFKNNRKINGTKRWLFVKVKRIDRPLTELIKEKREDPNKFRNE